MELSKPHILEPADPKDPCLYLQKELTDFIKNHPIYNKRFDREFEDEGNLLIDALKFPEQPKTNAYVLGCITDGNLFDLVCECSGLTIPYKKQEIATNYFNLHSLNPNVFDSFETNKEFGYNILDLRTFKMNGKKFPERVDVCIDLKLNGISFNENAPWIRLIKHRNVKSLTQSIMLIYIYSPEACAHFDKFIIEHSKDLAALKGKDIVYTTMFAGMAQDKIKDDRKTKPIF